MDNLLSKINTNINNGLLQINVLPFNLVKLMVPKTNEIGNFSKFTPLEHATLSLIKKKFYNMFIKNESQKSLEYPTFGPMIVEGTMVKKKNNFYIAYLKNNKLQLKKTYPVACYDFQERTLTWNNFDMLKGVCKNLHNNIDFYFCKFKKITNISDVDAGNIALWFRTMIFFKDIKLYGDGNNNLIQFELTIKNKTYMIYTISDHEYKDPKFTKEHSDIKGLINNMSTIFNKDKEKKSSKKRASKRKGSKKKASKKKGSKKRASKRKESKKKVSKKKASKKRANIIYGTHKLTNFV